MKIEKSENTKSREQIALFLKSNSHNLILFKNWINHLQFKSFKNTNDYYRLPPPIKKCNLRPRFIQKDRLNVPKMKKVCADDIKHLPDDDILSFLLINRNISLNELKDAINRED